MDRISNLVPGSHGFDDKPDTGNGIARRKNAGPSRGHRVRIDLYRPPPGGSNPGIRRGDIRIDPLPDRENDGIGREYTLGARNDVKVGTAIEEAVKFDLDAT